MHVRLMMDNTTAVACVNKMGTSHSELCNSVTKSIWDFCTERNIWISAAYIPGKANVEADEESRRINHDAEWKINSDMLLKALLCLKAKPDIDLFASRINFQFPKYMAYRPDPAAIAIDAFSVSWADRDFYAFPPFCIISRVLHKIIRDRAKGVLVVPNWASQCWYPRLARMLTQPPVLLPPGKNLVSLPAQPARKHRLYRSLQLLICTVSGSDSDCRDFRSRLQQSFAHHGGVGHKSSIPCISGVGESMRAGETLIPFRHV